MFTTSSSDGKFVIESIPGSFIISTAPAYHHHSRTFRLGWTSVEIERLQEQNIYLPTYYGLGMFMHQNYFQLAYIWPVSLCATALALMWVRPSARFRLRTLLIATTIIAMLLGQIVWAVS
jgi:hypothetical protein